MPNDFETSNHDPYTPLHHDIDIAVHDWSPWLDRQHFSAREWTSLYALCAMAKMCGRGPLEGSFRVWSSACITHLVLLRRLPLSERSFDVVQVPDRTFATTFLSQFPAFCLVGAAGISQDFKWDLFDLVDGRLLAFVLMKKPRLPEPLIAEVHRFALKVTQVTGVDILSNMVCSDSSDTTIGLRIHDDGQPTAQRARIVPSAYGVLPFSNPDLDDYLQDIRLTPNTVLEHKTLPAIFRVVSLA